MDAEETRASQAGEGGGGGERRPLTYCLVPAELASALHDLLRRHFRDDPGIEVVIERRRDDRRRDPDRRQPAEDEPSVEPERRQIRGSFGRRVAARRAALVPTPPPPLLPRRARRHLERLSFAERQEPSAQALEDADTARLVTRFQGGDREAFTIIYSRYFDRVYAYLRTALRDSHEAEDGTQQVFTQMFEALPRYERRSQPFRAWLFALVRNYAISRLRKSGRLELEDPAELDRHREARWEDGDSQRVLDWLSDRDLMIFVERLPITQRQVLLLRYVLDLSNKQIAEILGRSAIDIGRIHYRAMSFLRDRLGAVGRGPRRAERRSESRRPLTHVQVLRARRFALTWRT